jgi:putative long chain acyl-CoA synthase
VGEALARAREGLIRPAARLGAAAQNALEVIRFGGLETGEEPAPFEVVAERPVYRLRRYFPDGAPVDRPTILLVPPLMLSAEVYDVSPLASAVSILDQQGTAPFVVDFGAPEREAGGLERTLADHVVAVDDAVDRLRTATGRDVHLAGYSQGGMFCYQAAALRRGAGLGSVITFGSPVDTRAALPFGLPEAVATRGAGAIAAALRSRALPAWASRTGFRLLDPAKSLRQRLDFIRQLHDREALLPRERQRRFLEGEGWVAYPGPALADLVQEFVRHNRMLSGGFEIEGRLVTLADIACPVLTFVGEVDEIAPAPAVRAIRRAAPRAELHEASMRAGHFGLVVGSAATTFTWPTVAAWARWRDGEEGAEPPEGVRAVDHDEPITDGGGPGLGPRGALELAAGAGVQLGRSMAGAALRTAGAARDLTAAAAGQLPRLNRLEHVTPRTRISLGLLLSEQERQRPDATAFLWEDRAYTRADIGRRVNNVVRGLTSLGVRRGEHVGVLMATRPSALAVVAALSRLGAVAVLMRPDGPIELEAELGEVARIVTDPEHAEAARERTGADVLVLGGGGEPRDLGVAGVIDMERIDPDAVDLPAWYRPDPGLASDLAFVIFTGAGERTRAKVITNARWALSAFGTASSATLSEADTVYSLTPIHHASGLLMSIGGAVAGGARLALATEFDPQTFWDEVRRYGATIVSYTWTLLHDLAEADPHPGERHHPVRMFIGSGMPRGLWRRVIARFTPAQVLEFYASTEGDAVLVNLTGDKPGCKGRPLPGSSEVRLARWDAEAGKLAEGSDGLVLECATDEVGMLLSRVRPEMIETSKTPLRSLFEPDDAWLATGDLFRRDVDGDFWIVDHAPALIRTRAGMVAAFPIQDALGDLEAVDLCVVYGVPSADENEAVAVAAITLRRGRELDGEMLDAALAGLEPGARPDVVRAVGEVPVTTWYRPLTGALREEGLPEPDAPLPAWHLDRNADTYRQLTADARAALLGEDRIRFRETSEERRGDEPGREPDADRS